MNARPKRLAAALALACMLCGTSVAAALPGEAAEPHLIGALRANGADVVPLGAHGDLLGYFVTPAKAGGYSLYVTADGYAVAGLLYGPDGTEITGAQLAAVQGGVASATVEAAGSPAGAAGAGMIAHAATEASGAPSSDASSRALFERSAAAFGFTLGERGPLVVLMGDALCPWSRSAAARLGREALAGRLQLRVVPVAVLGADAARRAAAIAASADPARAWFEGPDGAADRLGGERIAGNNALFDAWGADAVPLIAWPVPGGAVAHRIGDIDDMGAWLQHTLGVQTLGPDSLRVGEPRAGHPRGGDPQDGGRP